MGDFVKLKRLIAVGLVVVGFGAFAGAASANDATVIERTQVSERLLELTIETPAFTEPTKVHVFLPTGYGTDQSRRWPVTYALAGMQNNYNSFANILDGVELTAGYPSIVVSPDGNSGFWSDWFNNGAGGPPQYETYVIDQLIPLIDASFRTIPDRSRRAIFGISMGGYGAMMLAAHHPDLFGSAATLSGAVDSNNLLIRSTISLAPTFDGGGIDAINGPLLTEELRWHANNPTDIAANLRGMDIQVRTANGILNPEIGEGANPADALSCAVEGGVYQGSTSFNARLDSLGIEHLWKDYGNGCHTKANFTREVVDTLNVFEQNFTSPAPAPSRFEYMTIKPAFDIWGWHVKADPGRALEFMTIEAGGNSISVTGSGSTSLVTPPLYKGLKKVDLNGKAFRPTSEGRLRFGVNLAAPHTVQQYRVGAPEQFLTGQVTFKPHAVIQILKAKRLRGGVRVCARTLGGVIPRALVKAGKAGLRVRLTGKASCRNLKSRTKPARVSVRGRDTYGHLIASSRKISLRG